MILNLRQKRNIVGILLIAMLFSTVSGFLYPNNKQVKAESDTTEKKTYYEESTDLLWTFSSDGTLEGHRMNKTTPSCYVVDLYPIDGVVAEVAKPEEIKQIVLGAGNFSVSIHNMPNLKSVSLQEVNELGSFTDCPQLKTVKIGSVNWINREIFSECQAFTEIEIEQASVIDQEAFSNCKNLERVSIKNGFVTIWDRAFSGCTSLKEVNIGANVQSIKTRAFSGCKNLTTLKLSNTVQKIENNAFAGCDGLSQIVMPKEITTVGIGSFTQCDIYWQGEKLTFESEEKERQFFAQMTGTMYIPENSSFWKKIRETYPNLSWKEWNPAEGKPDKVYELEELWAKGDQPGILQTVDDEGVSCLKLLLQERCQRVAFELPEDMDLSQYSSVSIKAKVGSQLMVDFADETLLANMENGMLLNADYTMTAEEMYPFFFDGSEGANLKYGTETTAIKGEDALSGSKYITIGTCKYPEEAEEAGREYVFYLYSITFHPSSDEDEKIVLTCKQPDIVQPTLEPSATPEPSAAPETSQTPEPSVVPETYQTPEAFTTSKPSETPAAFQATKKIKEIQPKIKIKKRDKNHLVYVTVTDKKATYFELYVKRKGKKYTKLKVAKKKLKKGKCTLRLVYTKKGNVLWFRARTYTKKNVRKIYHAFSKERKVKL